MPNANESNDPTRPTRPTGPMSLGERIVTAARLLAAEHVGQEVAAIRAAQSARAGVFANVPIVALDGERPMRVAVRRADRAPVGVLRPGEGRFIEPSRIGSRTAPRPLQRRAA